MSSKFYAFFIHYQILEPAAASVNFSNSQVTGQMTSIPITPAPSAAKPNPITSLPGHAELLKRQQELEAKEKELERRERQMQVLSR